MNNVKLTITRDFRLNVKKVDELISRQNEVIIIYINNMYFLDADT